MPWSRRNIALVAATAVAALPAALVGSAPASAAGSAPASAAGSAPASAAGSAARRPNSAVEVGTSKIGPLGTVLVRGSGRALYMFEPDLAHKITCSASCQKIWPPFYAPSTGVAKAIDGAKQSLIGSDRDPINGRRVVTYDGWPLYTYVLDTKKGEATGQNIALNGGFWWVLTTAGKINRTPVSHGGGDVAD